ncbi:MAG: DNA recombination protein RmuC, partial [Gammaproteobacteria bacterium]|nr:DNA recombination protein RmuC [Gammaproteobacteria bacterium]
IGKRTFAKLVAKSLLCTQTDPGDLAFCNRCETCLQVEKQTHPDVIYLARDRAKSVLTVDQLLGSDAARMREGFCYELRIRPYSGRRKIAIIDDADTLKEDTANCLLKTLEEPPPGAVIFLLGTSEKRQISTIRSRSQIVRFSPLSIQHVAELILRHKFLEDPTQALQLAERSHGSIQHAKELNDPRVDMRPLFELILEKVLERSGLVKDQEYRLQFSTSNDEGKRIQPDAVIMLPDNKHIVVDSKVSLVAYEAYVNCKSEDDKNKFVKEHIASVRNHIKSLSEKNYQSSLEFNTPDFVLLFIPIESSFSIAVQADQEMFNFAWDKKIVIVSPSTLLATLRTIASVWKQERQTKNAIEIAKQSGALYDKFVGFIEDMDKIGKNIDASKFVYDSAINKLYKGTGNLVKRAQDIEKLGAKTTKQIASKFIEGDEPSQLIEDVG